jgi:sec-independent protein translocase protein TatA
MFGLGLPELIVILVVALLIFGAAKLPEIGKALGKAMSEFKKATQGFTDTKDENKPKGE